MVNWQEIKEEYPNGCEKLNIWLSSNFRGYAVKYTCYCDLEKFFDDNGIIINYGKGNNNFKFSWWYNIRVNNQELEHIETDEYNSRQEAKQQAIYKAFEILEEKLNGIKTNK